MERELARLQLSVVGQFIMSLVDGQRSVADICLEGKRQRGYTEFEVCRLLHQLRSGDLIGT
jgi:hypothetical protein